MAKAFEVCKVCGARRFVNFAGLCKSCNKTKEGFKFVEQALGRRDERLAAQQEQLERDANKAGETTETEETTETSEKKEGDASEDKKDSKDKKD